jgi:hypothetical protein
MLLDPIATCGGSIHSFDSPVKRQGRSSAPIVGGEFGQEAFGIPEEMWYTQATLQETGGFEWASQFGATFP